MINGTNYFNCNGVYYKAGFQGNNVAYIVSTPYGSDEQLLKNVLASLRSLA